MTAARTVALVAWRDARERLASRAFQLSSVVILLVVAAIVVAPAFFEGDAPAWDIGVVGAGGPQLSDAVTAAAPEEGTTVTVHELTEADIATALEDGEVDVVVTGGELVAEQGTDPTLLSTVSSVIGTMRFAEAAAAAGLTPDQIDDLLATTAVEVRHIEQDEPDEANIGAAFVASIVLFVAIVTYGQWILAGVVEEKANRVVEVVLGAVRPHHLLAGKVLGIGALGVVQLIVVGAAALATRMAVSTVELPSNAASVAWIVMVWFLLGYAFYATAYAASGALVSRIEDAQNAAFPLTLLLMAGYFTASFSFAGDNPVLRTMSLLPPFAPMTMPVRMAAGTAAVWEVVLSMTLMVAATWLLIRGAGRVYAGGLLRARGRTKLREAWRGAAG